MSIILLGAFYLVCNFTWCYSNISIILYYISSVYYSYSVKTTNFV